MPAEVKLSELTVHRPVEIRFGFSGLGGEYALPVMRRIVRRGWPLQRRPKQSVYTIRLVGDVAVGYPTQFSPVVYVGEGNAYDRLYKHITDWLVPLLVSVPQLSVQVRIVEVARKNKADLYKHIEADLLRWFSDRHGSLPWFNRQWENSKERTYSYSPDARKELQKALEKNIFQISEKAETNILKNCLIGIVLVLF